MKKSQSTKVLQFMTLGEDGLKADSELEAKILTALQKHYTFDEAVKEVLPTRKPVDKGK